MTDLTIPALLNDALGFNIYRVALLYRRELIRALAEYKITPEQWQIMVTLWMTNQPLSQSDITKLTLKDKPTVSRMIQGLEKNNWVKKTVSESDKRVTLIEATSEGRRMQQPVTKMLFSHFDSVLKDFTKEEHQVMLDLLKKIRFFFDDI